MLTGNLLPKTPFNTMLFVLLTVYTSVGAMVIGEQHGHHGLITGSTYLVVFSLIFALIFYTKKGAKYFRSIASVLPLLIMLTIATPFIQRHYTKNQLKPNPLSSSIALEAPARALILHGQEMYSVTANGAPISPGPGWILLWSPISVPKLTGALEVIALAFAVVLLARKSTAAASLFALFMLIQFQFLSEMANGQDLYAISILLVALVLLVDYIMEKPKATLMLGFFAGLIATARVPIVAVTLLQGTYVWRKSRVMGFWYISAMLTTAVLLHGIFFIWALHNHDIYQPTHYLGRPSFGVAKPFIAGLSVVAAIWTLRSRNTAANCLAGMFFFMAALFTPEGIAEFFPARNLGWEGANYICFPIPVLLAAILFKVIENEAHSNDG